MSVRAWPACSGLLVLLVACSLPACSSEPVPAPATGAAAPESAAAQKAVEQAMAQAFNDTETHADAPPHGGKVVALGNHRAHAELVLVPDTGELTLHILDAEGQAGQRLAQPVVLADVETSGRAVRLELTANPLDGERSGDASRFSARSDDLLRMGEGRVTLRWIGVDGQVFSDLVVDFP